MTHRKAVALMVLVTLCAMAAGWLGWERHRAARRAATRAAFKDKASFIGFHSLFKPTAPSGLLLIRSWFGDEPVFRIHLDRNKWTEADVQEVLNLFPEAEVYREMPDAPPGKVATP